MSNVNENYSLKQYMQEIINEKIKIFDDLIRWGEQDKEQFAQLLSELEKPFDKSKETTKDKGDRLEKLV